MVLIFISWIYILFTTVNLGIGLDKIIKSSPSNLVIISFLGMFVTTILASIWAFFGRINIEFHLFLLFFNFVIFFKYRIEIKTIYKKFISEMKNLALPLKIFQVILFVLILAQCATAPYIIDNESYYIQTIKWINEYGFVKGLANLHIFFGQTSGWHVTQSVFNYSFLYSNFNDLSGFCLLLGTVFSTQKLNSYFENSNKNNLIIGLFPLANVFFFQFISAPSPDILIYVLTFIIFYYFLENFAAFSEENFKLISILVLFAVYSKVTSIGLLLIPLYLFLFNFKKLTTQVLKIMLLGIVVLLLFIFKNTVITGYPFYPIFSIKFENVAYRVPEIIMQYHFNEAKMYRDFATTAEYKAMNPFQIGLKWLLFSKLKGLLNTITVFVLLLLPYFIKKYGNKKEYWILYAMVVLQISLLLMSSPQFRFFIQYTLFFIFVIVACLQPNKKIILRALYLSVLPVLFALFFNQKYTVLTSNELINSSSTFKSDFLLFPHSNSKSAAVYVDVVKGNLKYHSPQQNNFFFGTGNGDLPCVNKTQIEYFETKLRVYPQMRTKNLKDGFYSKKTETHE